jgi:SPP1 family predicted phage head-tail adaptor
MLDPKKIGDFDRRVTISSTAAGTGTSVIDSFGYPEKDFVDLFTCWAAREEASGTANQENTTANRIILPASFTYYMHYRSNVTADMRLTDDGVEYYITSVDPIARKMFMRITAEKIID